MVEKLHDMGVCHLDIKPDNIMLGVSDEIAGKSRYKRTSNESDIFLIDLGRS